MVGIETAAGLFLGHSRHGTWPSLNGCSLLVACLNKGQAKILFLGLDLREKSGSNFNVILK